MDITAAAEHPVEEGGRIDILVELELEDGSMAGVVIEAKLCADLSPTQLKNYHVHARGRDGWHEDRWALLIVAPQGYFRRALLDYWGGGCPLTGISDEPLLRASHIVPWAECRSDEERLDVFNGLLLAAHWDAAFDRGLVSFDDEGHALVKPMLSEAALALLEPERVRPLPLDDAHRRQLAWHRERFGFN
ncbi:HNH endonuclease [Erythrobacter sp. BLCC-B19]|uniref:HNH endonuclease n=1 Tax=Erythrobacter sp. BLCC-B19 TaxID=3025315 RepID=UPI002361DF30|nr:HNH endonuclease [Erythrobacter sp. BLCC-B19]WDA42679.1 HNH endonuclease [Erythrobacter sp. BLCC-B19]